MKRPDAGFSLVELMMVCIIMVIISAMAVPAIQTTINNYRLDAAGHSLASLLQEARLQAVKTNQATYAHYDINQIPNLAFVGSDPTQAFVLGNPSVELNMATSFLTNGMPDHSQLDAYVGAGTVVEVGAPIGFNARGLPCVASLANMLLCQQLDPVNGGTPSFEWFVQSSRNKGWEAVTVTAAGRIKSWRLSNLDPTLQKCGYPACWN